MAPPPATSPRMTFGPGHLMTRKTLGRLLWLNATAYHQLTTACINHSSSRASMRTWGLPRSMSALQLYVQDQSTGKGDLVKECSVILSPE